MAEGGDESASGGTPPVFISYPLQDAPLQLPQSRQLPPGRVWQALLEDADKLLKQQRSLPR